MSSRRPSSADAPMISRYTWRVIALVGGRDSTSVPMPGCSSLTRMLTNSLVVTRCRSPPAPADSVPRCTGRCQRTRSPSCRRRRPGAAAPATIWRSTANTSSTVRPQASPAEVQVGGSRNVAAGREVVERLLGRDPAGPVGFGVLAVGPLSLRQCADKEVRVVAAGALLLRRHPVRPRSQQVGPQHQVLAPQEVGERQRVVGQCGPRIAVDGRVADDALRVVVRSGEQHAGLFEGFAGGGADQRLGQVGVDAQPVAHQAGSGPTQAMSALRSRSSTPPPGNTITPATKSIAGAGASGTP